eukprot:Sspe_Gene.58308::Locus_31975_Transcript_1_1_Confidence_1.000_Length_2903::g.58308::m.58308/K13755/PDE1; calcium/calmodulin-dependent 3',5'-cyclic nucleotide phosphodiesterase
MPVDFDFSLDIVAERAYEIFLEREERDISLKDELQKRRLLPSGLADGCEDGVEFLLAIVDTMIEGYIQFGLRCSEVLQASTYQVKSSLAGLRSSTVKLRQWVQEELRKVEKLSERAVEQYENAGRPTTKERSFASKCLLYEQKVAEMEEQIRDLKERNQELILKNVVGEQPRVSITHNLSDTVREWVGHAFAASTRHAKRRSTLAVMAEQRVPAAVADPILSPEPDSRLTRILPLRDTSPYTSDTEWRSILERHGVDPLVMKDVSQWGFDVTSLPDECGGELLCKVGIAVLARYSLWHTLEVNGRRLQLLLRDIGAGYMRVPYHNEQHAADVLQTTHALLEKTNAAWYLSDVEILSLLLSAVVHDYSHPGVTNNYISRGDPALVNLFHGRSLLENFHLSATYDMLNQPFCTLDSTKASKLRELINSNVLGTDISHHFESLDDFRLKPSSKLFLQLLLHAADVSNGAKPRHIYEKWTSRIMVEFWLQGACEKEEGIPVSPMCDAEATDLRMCQQGFLSSIVEPLYLSLSQYVDVGFALDEIRSNLEHWGCSPSVLSLPRTVVDSPDVTPLPTPPGPPLEQRAQEEYAVWMGELRGDLVSTVRHRLALVKGRLLSLLGMKGRASSQHLSSAVMRCESLSDEVQRPVKTDTPCDTALPPPCLGAAAVPLSGYPAVATVENGALQALQKLVDDEAKRRATLRYKQAEAKSLLVYKWAVETFRVAPRKKPLLVKPLKVKSSKARDLRRQSLEVSDPVWLARSGSAGSSRGSSPPGSARSSPSHPLPPLTPLNGSHPWPSYTPEIVETPTEHGELVTAFREAIGAVFQSAKDIRMERVAFQSRMAKCKEASLMSDSGLRRVLIGVIKDMSLTRSTHVLEIFSNWLLHRSGTPSPPTTGRKLVHPLNPN